MWRKKSTVLGTSFLALGLLAACTDSTRLPAAPEAEYRLFGAPDNPHLFANTKDDHLVRTAQEVEGFAGFYTDESGTLTIVMKGPPALTSGQEARLKNKLAAFGVSLESQSTNIVSGDYDFVELSQMMSRARHVMSAPGVVYTDIDEVANRIAIGVENDAAARQVEQALGQLGVPREAVVIREAEPIHMMQTLQSHVRPVAGGLQINFPGFLCTLGFNVRAPAAPNVHGFVTNSHCTNTQFSMLNTPYWQPSGSPNLASPNFIGTEAHDLAGFTGDICPVGRVCRYSDAAGVQYASGVSNAFARIYRPTGLGSLTIDVTNPMFHITDERPWPSVGDQMHKVGRTTGWTTGMVTSSCVNTNVAGTNFTLFCQDIVTGGANTVGGGDSGSPVFDNISGNNVRLVGLLWGGAGSTIFVFSAMDNIRFENTPAGMPAWRTFPPPPAP